MYRNLVAAAALLLSCSPVLAQQTPSDLSQVPVVSQPKATPEVRAARKAVREACMEDVRTLCAGSQPGGGKVMMCLKSHKDQVSAGCKTAFEHLRDVRRGA